jgi:hypothetical protein
MQKATYGLDLFYLLQKYKRKISLTTETDDFKAAKGIVNGLIVSIALWSILITLGIMIF